MSTQCPKSVISAKSLYFMDLYERWKRLGKGCMLSLDAKSADALMVLEQEWLAEQHDE